jgi:type I restriction enzyme, S subunit
MVEARRSHHWTEQPQVPRRNLSTTISLREVLQEGIRLEASAFNIEARVALAALYASGLPLAKLYGEEGLCHEATNVFRFRRIYVSPDRGMPFLSSSDIIALRAKPDRFLSRKLTHRLVDLLVQEWDVLISCSGTVGNVSLAGKSLAGMALSQHAIRLRAGDANTAGYVAAFLHSHYGRLQLTQASYGSVVSHIEPEHLKQIVIPNLHPLRRVPIGRLFVEACESRDEANRLLNLADEKLRERLNLPPFSNLANESEGIYSARIRASNLAQRLDASFHSSLAGTTYTRVMQLPCEVVPLGNPKCAKEIRPITKFRKRVYVEEGGIPLLSSKQLFQIDPVDVKRLAKGAHLKDMNEIELKENMLAVTRSGTIGRVQIIPLYMEGWAGSEHAIRVFSADGMNPGYLYTWLASDYGYILIKRHSYGSVIQEIDLDMLASVPVPLPEKSVRDEIGDFVLRANSLRNEAWEKERKAISLLETYVIRPDPSANS